MTAQADKMKAIRAVKHKYNLSEAQFDVLRHAARKFQGYGALKPSELHDGTVSTYNVRQETLAVLQSRGFIVFEHAFLGEERERRRAASDAIIAGAFERARTVEPFVLDSDGDPNWKWVLVDLKRAAALLQTLENKVWRITDAGRQVAAEWKAAIGAEEE
ncbi:MAG: hypothetical protein KGL39_37330 [Patescibacteria group bacterium]|nr:hypothetical protein [Patescibacteria group bacterium]